MVNFFKTEIRAYSDAAKAAAVAYEAGKPEAARRLQATAVIGCATLSRYLSDPFFVGQLRDDEQREIAWSIAELRASLASVELKCGTAAEAA